MNTSSVVIGFRVFTSSTQGVAVTYDGETTTAETKPCTRAEAYGRVSKFLNKYPNAQVPQIVEVTRPLTPLESASGELGGLLESLCRRHGVELGLSSDQVRTQIAKELSALGAGGSSFVATGIPRVGR